MSDTNLESRLLALRESIVAPREEDGTVATLVALMPCEPAIGEVAVVAWTDSAGGELLEIVRLDDGARIEDPVALRESLSLLAMVETVEDLASFDELAQLDDELGAFGTAEQLKLGDTFSRSRAGAHEAIAKLRGFEPGDDPRIARPQLLDELGGALRELERRWEQLEQAAELWSDAYLDASGRGDAAVELVQSLWRTLSIARRGPLARPVATALHEGREAGIAMAAAISASGA